MKDQCEYCNSQLEDTQQVCPNCGAPNPNYGRSSGDIPRTISELQQWYRDHNLPAPEVTRFFIGVDYRGARAFGIYREGQRFIVYKNKADGSRAVRYDGPDEAYAVNEIYLKLKEQIAEQKARNGGRAAKKQKKPLSERIKTAIAVILIVFGIGIWMFGHENRRGYYRYEGRQYYCLEDIWYCYDAIDGWYISEADSELADNASDYYLSSDYNASYGTTDFAGTEFYADWESNHSGSFWDSNDSWNSGGGDWDSDW